MVFISLVTQGLLLHKVEILLNPEWMDDDRDASYVKKIALAPLPDKYPFSMGIDHELLNQRGHKRFKSNMEIKKTSMVAYRYSI